MSEEIISDDSSHYEVSLTAGQAFLAFVLLLFSLAASFAFGLMVGKGQVDERLVVKREPSVINEGTAKEAKTSEARIVELGVPEGDDTPSTPAAEATSTTTDATIVEETTATETTAPAAAEVPSTPAADAPAPTIVEQKVEKPAEKPVSTEHAAEKPVVVSSAPKKPVAAASTTQSAPTPKTPVFAQLLSSTDAHAAETLAAKLIDSGFTSAYVERQKSASGMTYRVRVRFPSEPEARAAADRLRGISKSEPWITKQ